MLFEIKRILIETTALFANPEEEKCVEEQKEGIRLHRITDLINSHRKKLLSQDRVSDYFC